MPPFDGGDEPEPVATSAKRELRPYQAKGLADAKAAYRDGKRAICIVCPTGGGKTLLGSTFAVGAISKGGSVLWIAHREELLKQAQASIMREGLPHVGIIAPWARRQNAPVQVASVQTLVAQMKKDRALPTASLVVFDECVTGDTMIGALRADEIQVGDMVPSWDGRSVKMRRVLAASSRFAELIIELHISGRVLRCSDNHPIWVEGREYVRADEVREGDVCRVLDADEELRAQQVGEVLRTGLPQGSPSSAAQSVFDVRSIDSVVSGKRVARDMRGELLRKEQFCHHVGHEQGPRGGENATAQPYAGRGHEIQDGRDAAEHRASPTAGREWSSNGRAAGGSDHGARADVEAGIHGGHWAASDRRPESVHDRHSSPGDDDGDRSGRPWSHGQGGESERREEGSVSSLARVDRVEIHERARSQGFERVCPGGRVYNFEVEKDHNFFANGILTHNCHHAAADEWFKIAGAIRDKNGEKPLIIGLTATPERGDGRALGDLFDALIPVSSVRELQELGVLVPCVTYAPEHKTKALSREPFQAYKEHGEGERCFTFCVTVDHAEMVAAQFREAGYPAATIHANTPWKLRTARLEAFRLQSVAPLRRVGSIEDAPLVLCNVYTLTEGVDVPEASVCITARGIGHGGMMRQMVGRVLRCAPGKTRAIWWDLRGQNHKPKIGLPEADCDYSLEGKAIVVKESPDDPAIRCKNCGCEFFTWAVDGNGTRICPGCRCDAPPIPLPQTVEREVFAMGSGATEEDRIAALKRFAIEAADRGFRPGYVSVKFAEKYGYMPAHKVVDAMMLEARSVLGIRVAPAVIEAERVRLEEIAMRKGIPMSWVERAIVKKFGPGARAA